MRVHRLKTWVEPFCAIWDLDKLFEIRKDDRDFKVGERLDLREFVLEEKRYTGRRILAEITYKVPGGKWSLPEDLCVLGIRILDKQIDSAIPRVVVESPFAPQTAKIDTPHNQYFSEAEKKDVCYLHCPRCENEAVRATESARNQRYLDACLRDSVKRGEAPFASHGIFPRVLDDDNPPERRTGIDAGLCWADTGQLRAVYTDLGVSSGMSEGVERAKEIGQDVEFRDLGEGWDS